MTFENFIQKVKKAVGDYFSSEVQVSIRQVTKNNGVVLTGLVLMDEGSDSGVTIYLEELYETYKEGVTFAELVRRMIRTYEDGRRGLKLNIGFFYSYDKVRPCLAGRLINAERNAELLEKTPHEKIMNLALIACCVLVGEEMGCAEIIIGQEHLARWGKTAEEVLHDARQNMPRVLPEEVSTMEGLLIGNLQASLEESLQNGLAEELNLSREEQESLIRQSVSFLTRDCGRRKMYVVTNRHHFYGASAMLYPGVLGECAGIEGCSLFILPSSVHEVLLVSDDGQFDAAGLREMVMDVNRCHVSDEEYLSDDVYYYDRETGRITLA